MGEGGRSLGGGVVQHTQDQVASIRSSDRFGQRCSQTCRLKRSDDKTVTFKPEEENRQWATGVCSPGLVCVLAAAMLFPSGALILLLAALYCSLDLTEAEVSK